MTRRGMSRHWPRIRAVPQVFEPPAWAQRAACHGSSLDFYVDASKVRNRPAVEEARRSAAAVPSARTAPVRAPQRREVRDLGGLSERERSTLGAGPLRNAEGRLNLPHTPTERNNDASSDHPTSNSWEPDSASVTIRPSKQTIPRSSRPSLPADQRPLAAR